MNGWRGSASHRSLCCPPCSIRLVWKRLSAMASQQWFRTRTTIQFSLFYQRWMGRRKVTGLNFCVFFCIPKIGSGWWSHWLMCWDRLKLETSNQVKSWNASIVPPSKLRNMLCTWAVLSTRQPTGVLMEWWELVISNPFMEKRSMRRCWLRAKRFWHQWKR